jgi:hypothetical protein
MPRYKSLPSIVTLYATSLSSLLLFLAIGIQAQPLAHRQTLHFTINTRNLERDNPSSSITLRRLWPPSPTVPITTLIDRYQWTGKQLRFSIQLDAPVQDTAAFELLYESVRDRQQTVKKIKVVLAQLPESCNYHFVLERAYWKAPSYVNDGGFLYFVEVGMLERGLQNGQDTAYWHHYRAMRQQNHVVVQRHIQSHTDLEQVKQHNAFLERLHQRFNSPFASHTVNDYFKVVPEKAAPKNAFQSYHYTLKKQDHGQVPAQAITRYVHTTAPSMFRSKHGRRRSETVCTFYEDHTFIMETKTEPRPLDMPMSYHTVMLGFWSRSANTLQLQLPPEWQQFVRKAHSNYRKGPRSAYTNSDVQYYTFIGNSLVRKQGRYRQRFVRKFTRGGQRLRATSRSGWRICKTPMFITVP